MDMPITRAEYDEHNRRMDDEHHRINCRIKLLEESTRQIGQIASATEKMAISMENMLEEQRSRDGSWIPRETASRRWKKGREIPGRESKIRHWIRALAWCSALLLPARL